MRTAPTVKSVACFEKSFSLSIHVLLSNSEYGLVSHVSTKNPIAIWLLFLIHEVSYAIKIVEIN